MGEIIFWAIIRTAVIIPLLWVSRPYLEYGTWWFASIALLYAGIIHPATVHYRLYLEKNKTVLEESLCTSCRWFDESAVLCLKHDVHPSASYLPCGGLDWEPSAKDSSEEQIHY